MRLDSYLAKSGVSSRRHAKTIIKNGEITVDGKTIFSPGFNVDPERNRVVFNNQKITKDEPRYFLLYKPKGYVTTLRDPQGRATITSLLPHLKERVFPVGRLDINTEGLLLMTNDGQLAFRLTHPKFQKEKEYIAFVKGKISPEKIKMLEKGVELTDGKTSPARVIENKFMQAKNISSVRLVLHEGKKRQVRRMFKEIGHPLFSLKRTRFSFLTLKGLKPGQARELSSQEVKRLRSEANL